jgi:AraC-like DNA-binding protein
MKGGNVSSTPATMSTRAMMLMRRKSRFRLAHTRASVNHAASHTMMARPLTPESGPVGFHIFRAKVTHAALCAGYGTASSFVAAFHKVLGTTPTRYLSPRPATNR